MSHKAASPFPYPLTSDLAAFENQARAADLRDWSFAGRQCPYVLYGTGVAALVAYARRTLVKSVIGLPPIE